MENLPGNVYRRVRRPDGSYYFEYLSNGLFRQFEIDPERLLAQTEIKWDWVHPDDRARFIADLEVSAATLGLLDHRIRVVGSDGRVHWARGIARPSRRADGSVVWDGIVIEVTREVEAEAALRLAKEEADKAHTRAAGLVAAAAERLRGPLEELRRLLERVGAAGVLTPGEVKALRAVRERLETADTDLLNGTAAEIAPTPRRAALTDRQEEVLRLIEAGLSNKKIAQKLGITPGTAKLHVAAVLRAMDVTRRTELVRG